MLKLLEDIPPPGAKRVAIVIGRFNPPTKGHYALINKVRKFIKDNPKLNLEASPLVYVIGGSKSDNDKSKNPLSVDERMTFMKSSGKIDGVMLETAKNAFEAFTKARGAGYEPIAIAAGSDRVNEYAKILNRYFKTEDDQPITHYKVNLERDNDAVNANDSDLDGLLKSMEDGSDIETDLVSGSLARRAVELGYEEEFAEIVGLEDKPVLAKKMFAKIKSVLPEVA